MRAAPSQKRAYTYKVTVKPAELPVTLELFKAHINVTHALQDTILTLYLGAAINFAEKYTKRDLITRTYETYRDFFPSPAQNEGYYTFGSVPPGDFGANYSSGNYGFELRKSPLQSVSSVEYIDVAGDTQSLDASIWYNTLEVDYSEVLLSDGKNWPSDVANRLQAITITFLTGYADSEVDIDPDWKVAILNHATAIYANRGDCSEGTCAKTLPMESKVFYDQKKIINL